MPDTATLDTPAQEPAGERLAAKAAEDRGPLETAGHHAEARTEDIGVHPTRPATPPAGFPGIVPPSAAGATRAGHVTGEAMTSAGRTALLRRRRLTVVAFVGLAIAVLAVGQFLRPNGQSPVTTVVPAGSALPPAVRPGEIGEPATAGTTAESAGTASSTAATESEPPSDAATGSPSQVPAALGAFKIVTGYGPVLGTAGPVRRFKVAVEKTIARGTGADFADQVDRTLGDPRSWTASRQFRLRRVPATAKSEFTIYLASVRTSERMCAAGGLTTDGYTSCRLPGQVIINVARWEDAVPGYHAPIATYRAYAINHEVGHQFGYGHEACPGERRPAPVMQQQTYGLDGCTANAWPYIDGRRYAGDPVG